MWMIYFAVFVSESDADAFYSYLKTRSENNKFTFEKRMIAR